MKLFATTLAVLAVGVLFVSGAEAQEKTNPLYTNWAKYNVGTSVTLQTTTTRNGQTVSTMKQTQTLKKKTASVVEIEMTSTITAAGQEIPGASTTVTFKKTLDPGQVNDTQGSTPKSETAKGTESLKIDGASYKCNWVESEIHLGGNKTKSKAWICNDVPGMTVQSITQMAGGMVSEMKLVKVNKK